MKCKNEWRSVRKKERRIEVYYSLIFETRVQDLNEEGTPHFWHFFFTGTQIYHDPLTLHPVTEWCASSTRAKLPFPRSWPSRSYRPMVWIFLPMMTSEMTSEIVSGWVSCSHPRTCVVSQHDGRGHRCVVSDSSSRPSGSRSTTHTMTHRLTHILVKTLAHFWSNIPWSCIKSRTISVQLTTEDIYSCHCAAA